MSGSSEHVDPRRRGKARRRKRRTAVLATTAVATASAGALAVGLLVFPGGDDAIETVAAESQATGCEVGYQVTSEWTGGFNAEVTVTNVSDSATEGWAVTWTFADGQEVANAWNGEHGQDGSSVTVDNADWNAELAAGATAAFGFQADAPNGGTAPTEVSCSFGPGTDDPADDPAEDAGEEPTSESPAVTSTEEPEEESAEEPAEEPAEDTGNADAAADGPMGWASENGGTTGGEGGPTVTVSSGGELLDALEEDGPQVIEVSGSVELSGMNSVPSDTTIIGTDGAQITGGGLNLSGVENVIIRNIAFADWDDDAINVQQGSTNVWVDHNSFSNGYDGAVDVKRESDFVTVSWNHFSDHHKTMLLGHNDGHTQDAGHLRVSYHHNFLSGTASRHPRVRFGETVHVFNNYYVDNAYGVASTMDAGVLVEGNYFDGVRAPTYVGYGDSDDGRLVERDNVYANGSGEPESAGSVEAVPYDYSLDPAEDIPSIVSAGAGPGNI